MIIAGSTWLGLVSSIRAFHSETTERGLAVYFSTVNKNQ